jgi:hypothetical protein
VHSRPNAFEPNRLTLSRYQTLLAVFAGQHSLLAWPIIVNLTLRKNA